LAEAFFAGAALFPGAALFAACLEALAARGALAAALPATADFLAAPVVAGAAWVVFFCAALLCFAASFAEPLGWAAVLAVAPFFAGVLSRAAEAPLLAAAGVAARAFVFVVLDFVVGAFAGAFVAGFVEPVFVTGAFFAAFFADADESEAFF
jgi:hypothetical protein